MTVLLRQSEYAANLYLEADLINLKNRQHYYSEITKNMWSSKCSELQFKEDASLKIREDQCVRVLFYVNGCSLEYHSY